MEEVKIIKRDGTEQVYDQNKIFRALEKAGFPEDKAVPFLQQIETLLSISLERGKLTVDIIQDTIELTLMSNGYFDIARSYIAYRTKRTQLRKDRAKSDPTAIKEMIHVSKYAKHRPDLKRRESWVESCDRRVDMCVSRFPDLEEEIRAAYAPMYSQEFVPSMRSMQFGGKAALENNARMYNCSFSLADRQRFFSESFFLLLSGCGVGYSVQYRHVNRLPRINNIDQSSVYIHVVQDSIEGWAVALETLVDSYMGKGYPSYIEFDYSLVRHMGSPLKTSGGKAPGHIPLKKMIEKVREMFNEAQGRKLRPIEVHDIMCHIATAVLAGGIRRSSLISIFSPDDYEMKTAKTGNWAEKYLHRRMANNSMAIIKGDAHNYIDNYKEIFELCTQYGEPGFIFLPHPDYGCNPCGEIGLNPIDQETGETGFAFCNLCEINAIKVKDKEHFLSLCRDASIVGTLQATYTDFPYLTDATKRIAEREALLGVSITGIMDNLAIHDPEWLQEGAKVVVETNIEWARKLGINPAARCTTVKPSGTTSLLLGCVGSGIHPHHARRYFRRITFNKNEIPFLFFKEKNPHMCKKINDTDWVVEFCVEAPDGALVKEDFSAVEFAEKVMHFYSNWVIPGTANPHSSPGLTHNVSCTISVKEGEWDKLSDFIWKNRLDVAAMSLMPFTGDKEYPNAPREEIITVADEARWNEILNGYVPVDWNDLIEETDNTDPRGVGACEGPSCEAN